MDKAGCELEFEDNFDGDDLDKGRWIKHYLPHWSTWERSAARYELRDDCLHLLIDADQEPWCPELDGAIRVSSLQTGLFAGPVGSSLGQHRFYANEVVRQGPLDVRLYAPQFGLFEVRAKANPDPRTMVALWMIGLGDEPERSGEICVCEIFGSELTPDHVAVGVGVHPHGDPSIVDDFSKVAVLMNIREFHVYEAEWTRDHISFFIDGDLVKTVAQTISYPMQIMLGIYDFPGEGDPEPDTTAYPKRFVVDYIRGYRRVN